MEFRLAACSGRLTQRLAAGDVRVRRIAGGIVSAHPVAVACVAFESAVGKIADVRADRGDLGKITASRS